MPAQAPLNLVPVWAALLGATAAVLYAFLKSWFDRRQALNDIVTLLRAELENVARHARDSAVILTRSSFRVNDVQLAMCKFPDAGLVSVELKSLIGLPPSLVMDLMTLVIFLRNANLIIENAPASSPSTAKAIAQRLGSTSTWATKVLTGMRSRTLKGGVSYPKERQLTTIGDMT